ncbi:DNA-binding MarR family transcriptional regulator [Chitinophaga skermanii]|uniref:DNA-binding MarR family transcriptional regulator n=1 Tax=Chitinophaga skermanii TaxID=331697 RepID=A0A327QNT1_9BACT|nr:MarR family winged helix-turn-helix transcriptional regulator [Chitinophaga skermanii]RAJ05312.1 DNA-binding MarR family transcriptional regulator [Chitinophaga skermanii]
MAIEKTSDILFNTIDISIKKYRQLVQQSLVENDVDVTIDQWMVLSAFNETPDATQQQIANTINKDYASVTRMIELLVQKKLLKRTTHNQDRRRFNLSITPQATTLLKNLQPIMKANRKTALKGLKNNEIDQLNDLLNKIIANCEA